MRNLIKFLYILSVTDPDKDFGRRFNAFDELTDVWDKKALSMSVEGFGIGGVDSSNKVLEYILNRDYYLKITKKEVFKIARESNIPWENVCVF